MTTAIFIPTLKRHKKMESIVENIEATTPEPHKIYFILEASDLDSLRECARLGLDRCEGIINQRSGTYAGAINTAYLETDEQLFFCGADDLLFHDGWLSKLLVEIGRGFMVVGTNDLWNDFVKQGIHATHFLVDRLYIQKMSGVIDQPNTVLYEYDHNYCDTEFIGTAKFRGVFTPCLSSIVQHLHANKEHDEVVDKSLRNAVGDANVFHSRKAMWNERNPF